MGKSELINNMPTITMNFEDLKVKDLDWIEALESTREVEVNFDEGTVNIYKLV